MSTIRLETQQLGDGQFVDKTYVDTHLATKVDKIAGKGLSTEDYTTVEKTKLSGIAEGANVANNPTIGLFKTESSETAFSTFTLNQTENKEITLGIPEKTSELTNDSNFPSDASYVHTDNNYTTAEKTQVAKVATIEGIIPAQATSSNQLADKAFVNSSINNVAAYYITKNAAGAPFDTHAELAAATVFYCGGEVRVPTRNDYCVVEIDETHSNATTRYIYQGSQWEFQYVVNATSFTAAQLATINSGLAAADKTKIDSIAAGAEVNVQSDWNETDTASDAYINNKPTVPVVDSTISSTSTNALQNSTIYSKLNSNIVYQVGANQTFTDKVRLTKDFKNIATDATTSTETTINAATTTIAGVMSAADKTKLDGIQSGAVAITTTTTDPGAGSSLAAGTFLAVYEA